MIFINIVSFFNAKFLNPCLLAQSEPFGAHPFGSHPFGSEGFTCEGFTRFNAAILQCYNA